MRGRELYSLAEPYLRATRFVLRWTPRPICELALVLCRHFPTIVGVGVRYVLVARLARRCGRCVAIYEGVYLKGLAHMELGDNISIHPMCYIDAYGGLTVGSDVSIAHGVSVLTHNHDYRRPDVPIREAPALMGPVRIGSDVWIGCGARLLAGVTIGDGAVIGAGAVVTRSIEGRTIAVGIPARSIQPVRKAA